LSHDSVNRFLLRERYDPKDLLDEVKLQINLVGGTLSGDDTVIDKPHSDPSLAELIGYFLSGRHHRIVKCIQLITLYYTDLLGKSIPVNYRIYNKQEGKTKNDYLREMITEVLDWGVKQKMVTTDAWYSSLDNLRLLKNTLVGVSSGDCKKPTRCNRWLKIHPSQRAGNPRVRFVNVSEKIGICESISENIQKRIRQILHHVFTRPRCN